MARRMKSKTQPAQMRLQIDLPNSNPITGSTVSYVDLSQCASMINRRFYRQGLNWMVSGITLVDIRGGGLGEVTISKLPNTWVTSNAWEKTFRVWDEQNKKALAQAPSAKPRYYDYKIHFDDQHSTVVNQNPGFAQNLIPIGFVTNGVPDGEWIASDFKIPNTANAGGAVGAVESYTAHMCGYSNSTSKALIEGYADSRALPFSPDPNVPSDVSQNWLTAVFNEGTTQDNAVLNALEDDYDEVPYNLENYVGGGLRQPTGEVVDTVVFSGTTISSKIRIKSFNAPCGLIRLDNGTTNDLLMFIDLVPGDHRGYKCEPMTDM